MTSVDWVSVLDVSHDLVDVPYRGDLMAAAVAELEAYRHTRDAVTAELVEVNR